MPDATETTDAKPWQFKPGNSGNPAGRPKGSRHKLGAAFLEAMLSDFNEHGVTVVQSVRADRPHEYLRIIAGILPKELSGLDGEPLPAIVQLGALSEAALRELAALKDDGE